MSPTCRVRVLDLDEAQHLIPYNIDSTPTVSRLAAVERPPDYVSITRSIQHVRARAFCLAGSRAEAARHSDDVVGWRCAPGTRLGNVGEREPGWGSMRGWSRFVSHVMHE
jgi:hypothetical protein